MKTAFTDLVGVPHPIVGFNRSPSVVAAVANAGGFGVLAASAYTPAELDAQLSWLEDQTGGKPYGVDLLVPEKFVPGDPDHLVASLRAQIPAGHLAFVRDLLDRYGIPEAAPRASAEHDEIAASLNPTVSRARDGARTGIVVGRLDGDGSRLVAKGDDPELLDLLISAVVPAGTALEGARALAGEILQGSPTSVRISLRVMEETRGIPDVVDAVNHPTTALDDLMASEDAIEGVIAFAAERRPSGVTGNRRLLLEDVDGTGHDQGHRHDRDGGLHRHAHLRPAGQRHDIGGAECRGVGERQVQIVAERGLPARWSQLRAGHLHELKVWVDVSGVRPGNRATAVELPVPQAEHDHVREPDGATGDQERPGGVSFGAMYQPGHEPCHRPCVGEAEEGGESEARQPDRPRFGVDAARVSHHKAHQQQSL